MTLGLSAAVEASGEKALTPVEDRHISEPEMMVFAPAISGIVDFGGILCSSNHMLDLRLQNGATTFTILGTGFDNNSPIETQVLLSGSKWVVDGSNATILHLHHKIISASFQLIDTTKIQVRVRKIFGIDTGQTSAAPQSVTTDDAGVKSKKIFFAGNGDSALTIVTSNPGDSNFGFLPVTYVIYS